MPAQDVNVVNPPGKPVPVEVTNKKNQPAPVEIVNKSNETVPIIGEVKVTNVPSVKAQQEGAWTVDVRNLPGSSASVVQAARRYQIEPDFLGGPGSREFEVLEVRGRWAKVNVRDAGFPNMAPRDTYWMNIDLCHRIREL